MSPPGRHTSVKPRREKEATTTRGAKAEEAEQEGAPCEEAETEDSSQEEGTKGKMRLAS